MISLLWNGLRTRGVPKDRKQQPSWGAPGAGEENGTCSFALGQWLPGRTPDCEEIMEKPVRNDQRGEPAFLFGGWTYFRWMEEAGEGAGYCRLYILWRSPEKGKTLHVCQDRGQDRPQLGRLGSRYKTCKKFLVMITDSTRSMSRPHPYLPQAKSKFLCLGSLL